MDDERSYADQVDAPLSPATVAAIRAELKSGDYARYRKHERKGDGTSLGDRIKEYERVWTGKLTRRMPLVIRIDGRAFRTYLRGAEKPFDAAFSAQMGEVATALLQDVAGAVFAYGQSDEVSLLVCDYRELDTQPWFGGGIQKIASVSASIATAALGHVRGNRPTFDARVFVLPGAVEAANYFVWRQRDAMRNAVSMAAQAHFSPGRLHGVNSNTMKEMLAGWGIDFDSYPGAFRFGQVTERGSEHRGDAERTVYTTGPAPLFAAEPGGWLAKTIPGMPDYAEEG